MLRTLDGQPVTALFGISEQAPKGKALNQSIPTSRHVGISSHGQNGHFSHIIGATKGDCHDTRHSNRI